MSSLVSRKGIVHNVPVKEFYTTSFYSVVASHFGSVIQQPVGRLHTISVAGENHARV